ncbi:hypothetical protein GIB67_025692 [Kingdonia uniflora]|uniref:Uncharacterized protein n=1 Tax=Kingdonia uniflora TaxID=39325 RepID=A0A7J7P2T1_9MAGN|nr:hypothetical protein GIB67_025692 [Kingdonia uniflora]
MGNSFSPCYQVTSRSSVKLVFWEGTTQILTGRRIAGEVMFQFPDRIVCHADSFFIGHPIPTLAIGDRLVSGETYFVLPIDRFACRILSATSLSSLGSSPTRSPINFGQCPFQYIRIANGETLIKVIPEFMLKLIARGNGEICSSPTSFLCSTPELQKHYEQLVGSKDQVWSPKLDTISERQKRLSPIQYVFRGLDRSNKSKREV